MRVTHCYVFSDPILWLSDSRYKDIARSNTYDRMQLPARETISIKIKKSKVKITRSEFSLGKTGWVVNVVDRIRTSDRLEHRTRSRSWELWINIQHDREREEIQSVGDKSLYPFSKFESRHSPRIFEHPTSDGEVTKCQWQFKSTLTSSCISSMSAIRLLSDSEHWFLLQASSVKIQKKLE